MSTSSTPSSTAPVATGAINKLAVAGFVLSLVGLVLFILHWIAAVIALVGLILSIVGKVQINRTGARGNGFALAGIIIGIIGVIVGAGVFIAALAVVSANAGSIQQ